MGRRLHTASPTHFGGVNRLDDDTGLTMPVLIYYYISIIY